MELRLLNTMFEEESGEVQRFEREFKAIARLDHPNIVKVYDWGYADKRLYYVTELKAAKSLQTFLDEGRAFGIDETLSIGFELAGALSYLHGQGIIHRGLTPEAVLYDPETKRPIICEFTVIKDINRSDLTARGIGHLAPVQATPESLAGREVDPRADLYLLCSLLVKLLVKAEALAQMEVILRSAAEQALTESIIPPEVTAVLLKGLENEPDQRHPSAADLGAALKEVREKLRLADKRSATKRTRAGSDVGRITAPTDLRGRAASAAPSAAPPSSPPPSPPPPASIAPLQSGGAARQATPPPARPTLQQPPPPLDDKSGLLPKPADVPVALLVLGIGLPLLLLVVLFFLMR